MKIEVFMSLDLYLCFVGRVYSIMFFLFCSDLGGMIWFALGLEDSFSFLSCLYLFYSFG